MQLHSQPTTFPSNVLQFFSITMRVIILLCASLALAAAFPAKHLDNLSHRQLQQGANFQDACSSDSDCTGDFVYCVDQGGVVTCGYDTGDNCSSKEECGGRLLCTGGVCSNNFQDTCEVDADCSGQLFCYDQAGVVSCGYDLGEQCAEDDNCGGGLLCTDGVCTDNFQTSCTRDSECSSDLYCIGDVCGLESGKSCVQDFECGGGLECSSARCSTPIIIITPAPTPVRPAPTPKEPVNPEPTANEPVKPAPTPKDIAKPDSSSSSLSSIGAIITGAVVGFFGLVLRKLIGLSGCIGVTTPLSASYML